MPIKKLPSTYICYDKSAIAYYLCNKVQPSDLCIRLDITQKSGYILHHFYISHTLSHSRLHRNRNTVYSLKDDVTIYFLSQIFQSSRVKNISLSNYHVWTLWHVPAEPELSHLFCLLFVRFIIAQINPPNYCLYKYTNISWLLKVVCFKS